MGIRLVYGLKTRDASYLDSFYPSRRLAEAARNRAIDYEAIIYDPAVPPSSIVDYCSGHTALIRGDVPMLVYDALERAGVVTVNSAAATALAGDKLASADFFRTLKAAHPATALAPLDDPPFEYPFVVKPRYGKMGIGVRLVAGPDEWAPYAVSGGEYIAQRFVPTSYGRDIRFFFANFSHNTEITGEYSPVPVTGSTGLASVSVTRKSSHFVSNAHEGGTMHAFVPPSTLRKEAERIFMASALVYGTVDFLFASEDDSEFTVCEMNACPGFEELERASGLDVASAILRAAVLARPATRPGAIIMEKP